MKTAKMITTVLLSLLVFSFAAQLHSFIRVAEASGTYYSERFANGVTYTKGSGSSTGYLYTYANDGSYAVTTAAIGPRIGYKWVLSLDIAYTFNAGKPKSSLLNLAGLEVKGDARTDVDTEAGKTVYFYIYKYSTSAWQQIESFQGSDTDVWLSWNNNSDSLNYVDTNGDMKLRWKFTSDTDDMSQLWVDYQCIKLSFTEFEWTVTVYVDADWTYLAPDPEDPDHPYPHYGEGLALQDLNEMEVAGSTSKVAMLAQLDRYLSGSNMYFIKKDEDPEEFHGENLLYQGEVNMGDPATFESFLNWTICNYPAEHFAVILWDHGRGFRGTCKDGHSGDDDLSLSELKSSFANSMAATGKTIDMIGFMACRMQQVEVAYQLKDKANVMAASQAPISSAQNWDFDEFLTELVNDPANTDEYDLAEMIVSTFNGRTMSSVNLTNMESFTDALDDFAGCLQAKLATYRSSIESCREQTQSTKDAAYEVDLWHFAQLVRSIGDAELVANATALQAEIEQTVLCRKNSGEFAGVHGMSIFFPNRTQGGITEYNAWSEVYEELDISVDHDWDEFLVAFLEI